MGRAQSNHSLTAAFLVVLAGLAGIAALGWNGGEGGREQARSAPRRATDVAVVARRVEQLRGVRFTRKPVPVRVSPEQARAEGLRSLDRDYPAARRRADEDVLTLLGLVEPGTDLRDISASIFGEEVAGYYDPRSGRLRVVDGAATSTPLLAEITLAHELVHALEDQRFELRTDVSGTDDAQLAYSALVEGTATAVMFEYAERHFTASEALAGLLPSAFGGSGSDLPPFIMAQLVFPYEGGRAFVEELYRRAGGRWALADLALRERPPASTEQVLHPEKYLGAEPPIAVRMPGAGARLGPRWRRAHAGVLGEWATGALLGDAAVARGWGGDRYELWRKGRETALIVRWRWDDPAGARAFARALRRYAAGHDGPGVAGVSERGDALTLAIAPDSGAAARLASTR